MRPRALNLVAPPPFYVPANAVKGARKMRDLAKLPNDLDPTTGLCRAIIETPKGRRYKYDFDRELRLFRAKSLLPEGMSFPLDFGFIPSTLCDDGDPLDVMVLADEPVFPGALLEVRLIGVLEAEEAEKGEVERNDRVLATSTLSHLYRDVRTLKDLAGSFIDELTQFWVNKDRLEGKTFRVIGVGEPPAAIQLVRQTTRTAKKAA